jgi:16S rRNA G966 N2-methylase RsmD
MNKLISLFPITNEIKNLQYDNEGLYSITYSKDADEISNLILSNYKINQLELNNLEIKELNIVDCTAGLGGNTFSFSKFFKNVTSIEINKNRFEMLKNNILLYKLNNIKLVNTNCIEYIQNNKDYNIYFFDPPWGGRDYKNHDKLTLKLDNYELNYIINLLIDKMIVFKLPYNYNLSEFSKYNYKLYKIKNYFIIII